VTIARSKMLGALAAITLVAVSAVGLRVSDPDEKKSEVIDGVIGKPVKVNDGEVTVTQVKVGTILKQYGEIQDSTDGMFVAVSVTGAATGSKRLEFNAARLLSGDVRYEGYQLSSGVNSDPGSRPQLTVSSRWTRPRSTISPWRWGRTRSSTATSSAYASSSALRVPTPRSGARLPRVSSNPSR
jgi:hypothetical protein